MERELEEAIRGWNNTRLYQELQQKGVKWTFHPLTAAHMSGVWERLVQSAKKHLKAVVGDRLLSEFVLRTLFTEVEFSMNNRPIVAALDDPADLEALTPNHFLLQRKVTGLPHGVFVKQDHLGRKQWRKVQYLTDVFWKRWISEYLPTLTEREKWLKDQRNVRVGDLVLILEEKTENIMSCYFPIFAISFVTFVCILYQVIFACCAGMFVWLLEILKRVHVVSDECNAFLVL